MAVAATAATVNRYMSSLKLSHRGDLTGVSAAVPNVPDSSEQSTGARASLARTAVVRRALRGASGALPVLFVTALPVLLSRGLWAEVLNGGYARAWDGSGHYALARLYSESIFPDVYGWADAYFAGMGFPNYYPPLFYWLVALLQHTGLLTFGAAFKLVLVAPTLLLPAAVWLLAWRLSGGRRAAAACAALAVAPLLVDVRLSNTEGLMGLSYTSTFLLGLYTQPLGFVLLVGWYVLYTSEGLPRRAWRAAAASILLALALLANFFSSNVAALLILTTVVQDFMRLRRAGTRAGRAAERRALLAHLLSPLAGACLILFWVGPLLASYTYVVTRPEQVGLGQLVPTALWLWYALALAGGILWLRRAPSRPARAFLAACALLAAATFLGQGLSPRWFPSHPPRLASTLNFLLAAPAGYALAYALRLLALALGRKARFGAGRVPRLAPVGLALLAALVLGSELQPPPSGLAFYNEADWARVSPVLEFAAGHRDGRYLVENQSFADPAAAHDGRAISAYLGMQGNASLSLFFREASPNVLFLNPLVDIFSAQPDSYGISSVLADDADFGRRTLASQIERARFYGTKYLVIRSQAMKGHLAAEPAVSARQDFGQWSVFELAGGSRPQTRALAFRPALVVSDLTLKLRRSNDYGFIRLAEEQFASGWFDVVLARSPELRLDRLEVPEGFGSVVVDSYRYDDLDRAYARLRNIAREHHLILLSSDDQLFHRVQAALGEFPQAEVVARPREEPSEWLDSNRPTRSYDDSPVRMTWGRLRQALEGHKVATGAVADAALGAALRPGVIPLDPPEGSANPIPVLIATTFHPDWQRGDGGEVYAATPFFMLTFISGHDALVFDRSGADRVGLYTSGATLLLLLLFIALYRGARGPQREEQSATGGQVVDVVA